MFCIGIVLAGGMISSQSVHYTLLSPLQGSSVLSAQIVQNPLASLIPNAFAKDGEHIELVGFAPGWALKRMRNIQFDGLDKIAYFDIPVLEGGHIDKDNYAYETLTGSEFSSIKDQAQEKNVEVLVTISQTNGDIVSSLLEDTEAQEVLGTELIEDIEANNWDGITLALEYDRSNASLYRDKYTAFVKTLSSRIHGALEGKSVHVVVYNSSMKSSFYDSVSLATVSDGVIMVAEDFAVPEISKALPTASTYVNDSNEYWKDVEVWANSFLKEIPASKLAIEAAWYGNADNYPFYGSGTPDTFTVPSSLTTPLPTALIEDLVQSVPSRSRSSARKHIPLIAEALAKENILSANVLAYALATIEHETAGTFEPIEEIKGKRSAKRLGYEGGSAYFGRGFIQITHLRNYKKSGERIGVCDELVKNPSRALDPVISAGILAAFIKDNNVARLAYNGDFVLARKPINPDQNGYAVARMARKYLNGDFSLAKPSKV